MGRGGGKAGERAREQRRADDGPAGQLAHPGQAGVARAGVIALVPHAISEAAESQGPLSGT